MSEIGISATDGVVMLVVDERTSVSIGLTLHQLGHWIRRQGAVEAVNLDEGGSATMWIKGKGVVDRPTDTTGERPVSNPVLILHVADPQEIAPLTRATP
jgi:exopolysaccharide biosynthesis protein